MKNTERWRECVRLARKHLNIVGFRKIKKGTDLYIKARELYGGASEEIQLWAAA